MKILHTSDWHVGKTLRGRSRIAEHEAVLGEIVALADRERPDLTLVVGDLFEHTAPSPEAQAVVYRTLLALRDTGTRLVVVAGNHDNAAALEAVRTVFGALDVVVAGHVRRPDDGGAVTVEAATGERARVALVPFLSQRYVVKAAELMAGTAADAAGEYAGRLAGVVGALTPQATAANDTVNVVAAHCFVRGGRAGGGERDAHLTNAYGCDAAIFPPTTHYVALGHLHRTQQISAGAPVWYSGSPIQVDFGEQGEAKHVLLVEATPTTPAVVTKVPLTSPWQLDTVVGTFAELEAQAPALAGDPGGTASPRFLRVVVQERTRAGLADDVRALLPNAVEVRVDASGHATPPGQPATGDATARHTRRPHELFAEYLAERGVADDDVTRLFADLYDEATASPGS